MKKIEADTLEEAYKNAAKELNCSVIEIDYEIVQYPTTGMMGLFKKPAIIIAVRKVTANKAIKEPIQEEKSSTKEVTSKETVLNTESIPQTDKEESNSKKSAPLSKEALLSTQISQKKDTVLDGFFELEKPTEIAVTTKEVVEEKVVTKPIVNTNVTSQADPKEEYFEHAFDDDRDSPKNRELSIEIEGKLKVLFASSCFEIDTVEVDVFNNTAHMFVDGEDAALLIGKEGYRYNALSYMLFNWINTQYDLYIKLEIAEFIQTQEEMIINYLKPIIEHVTEKGRGKTKPLDGILVQIALEQLRAAFPNKYVAIKTGKDGNKFIIINNFNNKKTG